MAESYRPVLAKVKTEEQLYHTLPRDNTLLQNFVSYAAERGVPARWYYIRRSKDLILRQLKAVIVRDVLGYSPFIKALNEYDPVVNEGLKALDRPAFKKK